MRALILSIVAHALDAAHRSACAVRETVAIAWDRLTAPAPLAGGEMREQRDQAIAERDSIAVDREVMAREAVRQQRRADDGARLVLASAEERSELRRQVADAARNLSAAEAVIADQRERLRALDAAIGSEGEPLQSLQTVLRLLGAREGETVLRAAERLRKILHAAVKEPLDEAAVGAMAAVERYGDAIDMARTILGAYGGETLREVAERVTAERKRLEQWARIPSEPDHA